MSNFNKTEIESIKSFLQNFVEESVKTLSQNLDEDVYKKIELFVNSCTELNNIGNFKNNNIIYRLDYTKGKYISTLGLLLPEELVTNISDVLTGGNGDKAFKGTLSEVEINAIEELAKKVFDGIEDLFKKIYTNDFGFSTEPSILTKEMPNFENEIEIHEFNFVINITLRINSQEEYPVLLLLKSQDFKKILTSLSVFQHQGESGGSFQHNIKIDQLSDVKIDITAELGCARVPIKYAMELVRDSLIQLDTISNSDIKVFANDVEVARAQVVAVGDSFGLKITKIISPEERIKLV